MFFRGGSEGGFDLALLLGDPLLLDVVVAVFAEDLERSPARHFGHAWHSGCHRAGRIDHPGIVRVFEPECHHVVLVVFKAIDDRPEDFVFAKSQIAQQVVDEELEAVAVVAVGSKRLFECRPMVDRPVRDVVLLGLLLNPVRQFASQSAFVLLTELGVLEPKVGGAVGRSPRIRTRRNRRGRGLGVRRVPLGPLAGLPDFDLVPPGIVDGRLGEIPLRERLGQYTRATPADPHGEAKYGRGTQPMC